MHLFLQGSSGTGKSTLLQRALAPHWQTVAGFWVQRLLDGQESAGFRVVPVTAGPPGPLTAPYRPGLPGVFLLHQRQDVSVLEQVMMRTVQDSKAPRCRLVLLDEIGGMELASPVFSELLVQVLSGALPCVGVFKSRGNFQRMAAAHGLAPQAAVLHRELEALLRSRGELLTVTGDNREQVQAHLHHYLCTARQL